MTVLLLKNVNIADIQREMSNMLHESIPHSLVRKLAEQAVGQDTDKIGAIFNFVHDVFPYSPDPIGFELFICPKKVAEDYYAGHIRQMDCDDKSLLTAALLGSLGYQTRIILVSINGGELDHALCELNTKNIGWLPLDSTRDFPLGWQMKQYDNKVIVN